MKGTFFFVVVGGGGFTKNLILPLTVRLFQGVLEAELTELKERERSLQKELEVLQEASRGQERDLLTVNSVLQSNQDVINVKQTQGLSETNTHNVCC